MIARLLPLLLAAGVSACGEASLDGVDPRLFTAQPTYDDEIRPLFEAYCVQCHAQDGKVLGGVVLDTYETARARRVHNACVSLTQPVIDHFAASLVPLRLQSETATRAPCTDTGLGGELRPWEPYSMPVGARSGMTIEEQVMLGRWVELGAPR